MKNNILAVVGPTASGKTALSVELAVRLGGEIISADSMQIYKGMRIATAKPTPDETRGIKHYMLDFLSPGEAYSVGKYVIDAEKAAFEIIFDGKLPILCGGTGLYVDSFLNGLEFKESSSDQNLREELEAVFEEKGVDFLLNELAQFDPESAERLAFERNPKRIIRAIEFYITTGKTITQQNIESRQKEPKFKPFIIGLKASDRQYLYDRINHRVNNMLEEGLLEEAREVLNSDLSGTASAAIGYKELAPYFSGEKTLEECIERIKTETRRYAKRQLTWFRRNENIHWINIDELRTTDEQADYAIKLIEQEGFLNGQIII